MNGRGLHPDRSWCRCVAIGVLSMALFTAQGLELRADPVISEFMAVNSRTLADESGQFPDWIEIHNPEFEPIDLGGWHLTDDEDNLTRWRFPPVEISAGGYLIVFASGEDRAEDGSELHTSFRLSGGGEYLALVRPDGVTIAHEYAPEYPEQRGDVSYGIFDRIEETVYVPAETQATVLVPSGPELSTEWTGGSEPFTDEAWTLARTGVGYDRSSPRDGPLFTPHQGFDAFESGELDEQGGWQGSSENARVASDPSRGDNKVLEVSGSRTRAHGALVIAEGTVATVFFRLRFSAGTDVSIGLSAASRPTSTRHFETQMRVVHEAPEAPSAALEIRDGADERVVGALLPETWYGVWMLADAMTDSYQLYIQGGELDEPTQVSGEGGEAVFSFRNGEDDEDLLHFYVRSESGQDGAVLIDDLHVSEGANLANPATSYRRAIDPAGGPRGEPVREERVGLHPHSLLSRGPAAARPAHAPHPVRRRVRRVPERSRSRPPERSRGASMELGGYGCASERRGRPVRADRHHGLERCLPRGKTQHSRDPRPSTSTRRMTISSSRRSSSRRASWVGPSSSSRAPRRALRIVPATKEPWRTPVFSAPGGFQGGPVEVAISHRDRRRGDPLHH